jgi:hypothetical protein
MASSTNTMMHGVRGVFRFAHIDGLNPADRPCTATGSCTRSLVAQIDATRLVVNSL